MTSVRAQAPHWQRAHAWCRCCVQVYVHSACVSSAAHKGTLPLSRRSGQHSRTPPSPLLPPTRRADVHVPLGTLLPSWFHFCATRARSDAQDSRTALLTAVTRSSSWHPTGKDSCERKQKLHAQFQGCPSSSDHPKFAVRSICQTQRCTCPQRRVEQECLKQRKKGEGTEGTRRRRTR